ncbi:hypothetical protein ACHAWF_004932, partial [Thalassiosira exigua]
GFGRERNRGDPEGPAASAAERRRAAAAAAAASARRAAATGGCLGSAAAAAKYAPITARTTCEHRQLSHPVQHRDAPAQLPTSAVRDATTRAAAKVHARVAPLRRAGHDQPHTKSEPRPRGAGRAHPAQLPLRRRRPPQLPELWPRCRRRPKLLPLRPRRAADVDARRRPPPLPHPPSPTLGLARHPLPSPPVPRPLGARGAVVVLRGRRRRPHRRGDLVRRHRDGTVRRSGGTVDPPGADAGRHLLRGDLHGHRTRLERELARPERVRRANGGDATVRDRSGGVEGAPGRRPPDAGDAEDRRHERGRHAGGIPGPVRERPPRGGSARDRGGGSGGTRRSRGGRGGLPSAAGSGPPPRVRVVQRPERRARRPGPAGAAGGSVRGSKGGPRPGAELRVRLVDPRFDLRDRAGGHGDPLDEPRRLRSALGRPGPVDVPGDRVRRRLRVGRVEGSFLRVGSRVPVRAAERGRPLGVRRRGILAGSWVSHLDGGSEGVRFGNKVQPLS